MNKLELPNLDRWRAGELPDEEMFNQLKDAQDFMLDPPGVKLVTTQPQTIPNNSYQSVQWHAALNDNCKPFGLGYATAMWNPTTSWNITCRVGGWYEVNVTLAWANTTDDGKRSMFFNINGNVSGIWQNGRRDKWHGTGNSVVTNDTPVFLSVGDYITVWVLQNKGSSTSLIADQTSSAPTYRRSMLSMRWVSL